MFDADKIARDTVQTMINHLSHLYLRLAWSGSTHEAATQMYGWLESSPVLEEVRLLVRAANGELARDPATLGEVAETIQSVVELLFAQPGSNSYDIPDHFWSSDLGQVIRHAQLFARGDDLITHTEAAQMLYGAADERELMRVRRLIERGEMTAYADPREPNPQKAGRVSRAEVERLNSG